MVSIEVADSASAMGLDLNARRNLELTETIRNKERKGSLLWLLDDARTAMGKRLLKTWIEQPLVQPVKIMARLDAVGAFVKKSIVLMEVRDLLDHVYDLERLMTRVIYQKATPRDLKSLSMTAQQLPELKMQLQKLAEDSRLISTLEQQISPLERVTNLVENAIKYNHDEGWVHVSLNADHKYFYVKVSDSGIGIPKEDLARVFERFYRVDKARSREMGGTGLGLSIAKEIIEQNNGSIDIKSELGKGTEVVIRIPAVKKGTENE